MTCGYPLNQRSKNHYLKVFLLFGSLIFSGCGGIQVEGRFKIIQAPIFPLGNIGLIEVDNEKVEAVTLAPNPELIPQRNMMVKALIGSAHWGKNEALNGFSLCTDFLQADDDVYSEKPLEDAVGKIGLFLILCPLMTVTGGTVGILGGPFLDLEPLPTEQNSLPDSEILQYVIFQDWIIRKIWSQLREQTDVSSSKLTKDSNIIQFSNSNEPINFIKISPLRIGFFSISHIDRALLSFELKLRILFIDQDDHVWAEQEIEATIGEFIFHEWIADDAKRVKDALQNSHAVIAQHILKGLQTNLASLKTGSSLN